MVLCGEIVFCVTEKTIVAVVLFPWYFAEAIGELLTGDALDPQAKVPDFKRSRRGTRSCRVLMRWYAGDKLEFTANVRMLQLRDSLS